MNRENAHLYIPLLQAWTDGKQLQWLREDGHWINFKPDEELFWGRPPEEYRIKPEPKVIWVNELLSGDTISFRNPASAQRNSSPQCNRIAVKYVEEVKPE